MRISDWSSDVGSSDLAARIWYVPIDGPGKPPRIVRIDLGASSPADAVRQGEGGVAFRIVQGRIADEANILPADSKAQLDAVLTAFDQRSGHPLVIVTTPSLGGLDIARFAATIADRRGMADSGILFLVEIGRAACRERVGQYG